jgi:hypothetical protein
MTRTPVGIFTALALLGVGARGQGVDPAAAVPEALRAHLRVERLAPIATVAALPAGVRTELQDLFGDRALELADPGKPFQSTDLVQVPRLPWRRLVAAGCSTDHCLVYYERGGYARVYYALVLRISANGAALEFGGSAPGGLRDLEEVRTAVTSGQVVGQAKTKYW